jgi:hypothetical protein
VVSVQCQGGAEGRSVGEWVVRDGPSAAALVLHEHQRLIVGIHLGSLGDRIIVLASCTQ